MWCVLDNIQHAAAVRSVQYCCDSFSILVYLDTYVWWSHISIFVWGIRFVSVIVCIIFCFYLFSSWGNFPLQSYWSLFCDHGLHCSDEWMWEQQQQQVCTFFCVLRPEKSKRAVVTKPCLTLLLTTKILPIIHEIASGKVFFFCSAAAAVQRCCCVCFFMSY